jgi:hypothetical protein
MVQKYLANDSDPVHIEQYRVSAGWLGSALYASVLAPPLYQNVDFTTARAVMACGDIHLHFYRSYPCKQVP